MKLWPLYLLLLLLLLPGLALAQEAEDITNACIINNRAYNPKAPDDLRDGELSSFFTTRALTIQAPEGKKIAALEIRWRTIVLPGLIVEKQEGGEWVEVLRDGPNYAVQYVALSEPLDAVRLTSTSGKLELCELRVLTEGEPPADVQIWQDAPEKVDLMLFATHPDDEVLWFGGLLPYYAGELDRDVLVVNAVFSHFFRRQELLNALWTCGVDIYPVMLGYPNQQDSVEDVLIEWRAIERQPDDTCLSLVRQYEPDVVVLHDIKGEYGHTAHIAFSLLGRQAVERAADPAEHPASLEKWGVWDVPKTYIHLYPENQLRMDWKQPLSAFGGKTGLEVATEAFACHVSQRKRWIMQDGGKYDNALFGLWRTAVGPDAEKNDLFENVPAR